MATYLVTGGAGFIGSHLCDELVKKNKVYVFDNISTGRRANLPEGVELIEGDIRNYSQLEEAMSKVDGCFHLSAMVSIPLCNEDLLGTHEVNLTGTLNVIESSRALSKASKLIPIVFASTCAVYGDNPNLPNTEDGLTIPVSIYAASKLAGEYYGRFANEIYKVPFTALRLFNVYGTRQDLESSYSGVIPIFLNALMNGRPCIYYGDGSHSRDFISIKDLVRFFIRAMETSTDKMRIYNACTGRGTDVRTIAKLLSQILNKKLVVEHRPAKIGDIKHSLGCPLLAERELKLVASLSIESGLRDYVADILEGR